MLMLNAPIAARPDHASEGFSDELLAAILANDPCALDDEPAPYTALDDAYRCGLELGLDCWSIGEPDAPADLPETHRAAFRAGWEQGRREAHEERLQISDVFEAQQRREWMDHNAALDEMAEEARYEEMCMAEAGIVCRPDAEPGR